MIVKLPKTGRTEAQVMAAVIDAARILGIDMDRQNTGGFLNPRGQYVACGKRGNADLTGMLPGGRKLDVEVKREGWRPEKARGEDAERWALQLTRLQMTNDQGGVGFWIDDAERFLVIIRHVLAGARVVENGHSLEVIYPNGEESIAEHHA